MCEQTGERAGVFLNTLDPQKGKKTSGKRGFFMVPLSEHCSPQVPGGQRKNQATLRLQTVTKREHDLGLRLRQRNLVRAVEFLNFLNLENSKFFAMVIASNSTLYVLQTRQIACQYNRDDLARLHLPSTPHSVPGHRTLNGHRISRTHSHSHPGGE